MKPFDCLSTACPILGPHLLEASAGTGKTFSIEHVFVRLFLECPTLRLDEILAMTFTRASAREMKSRIRANFEEALSILRSQEGKWEYLKPYYGSSFAEQRMQEALLQFDRCQIFTIHGFCYRMLQEFAFEALLSFVLQDPDEGVKISKKMRRRAKQFLQSGLEHSNLEQIQIFTSGKKDLDGLIDPLLQKRKKGEAPSFTALSEEFSKHFSIQLQEEKLIEDFMHIFSRYKKMGEKEEYFSQLKALVKRDFGGLIKKKRSLVDLLHPKQLKKKGMPPDVPLHYPQFWENDFPKIAPLVEKARNLQGIVAHLQAEWEKRASLFNDDACLSDPDAILNKMHQALNAPSFLKKVQDKYKAVIIDEFQDTDPLQWEIFKTLFWKKSLDALYLVGDPKQSIYRFRNADVYTYFQAKELLGEKGWFSLQTNYRSSPALVDSLNALFARKWLLLPKTGGTIECPPVQAGKEKGLDFQDGKGAIHILFDAEPKSEQYGLDEEKFFIYCAQQIHQLFPFFGKLKSFAILVKDRYQSKRAVEILAKQGIASSAKSHAALGETAAFAAVNELFQALLFPKDSAKQRLVTASPFAYLPSAYDAIQEIEAEGLSFFFRRFAFCPGDQSFHDDLSQIIEEILCWESKEGFSFLTLVSFLQEMKEQSSDQKGRISSNLEHDQVQILTMHTSKGLEFEVVFAPGVSMAPPRTESKEAAEKEELNAEKLRQLYVACTRAKQRLYIPVKLKDTVSPMGLFSSLVAEQETSLFDLVETLSKTHSITYEFLADVSFSSFNQAPLECRKKKEMADPFFDSRPLSCFITPSWIHSFTSLHHASNKQPPIPSKTENISAILDPIPKGPKTGVLIHQIFETIFSSSHALWRHPDKIISCVDTILAGSFLAPFSEAIIARVINTLQLPLPGGFSLMDLEEGKIQAEMEFLYRDKKLSGYVTGSIDLVFFHHNKLYFADWKTNILKQGDSIDSVMQEHEYRMQAEIYTEALKRHVKRFDMPPFEEIFGGAFYFFIRNDAIDYWIPGSKEVIPFIDNKF